MRITIEDLESLKELNDELEENHLETEKQLYDDIGMGPPPTYHIMANSLVQKRGILRFVNI